MANTFRNYHPETYNRGIYALCEELINFRKQLTVRPEIKSQSGWNDSLNTFMATRLERVADTLESVTYSPSGQTQEELEEQASDTTRSLHDDYNSTSVNTDNLLLPAGRAIPFRWVLDGSDPDIPQLTLADCPNDWAYAFITDLDSIFVDVTRLDSRSQPSTITKFESAAIRARLNELYTIVQRKGGEANRNDVPTGTLPSQEPGTLNS